MYKLSQINPLHILSINDEGLIKSALEHFFACTLLKDLVGFILLALESCLLPYQSANPCSLKDLNINLV